MKSYKRGEVAKITGVGFEGIRFYERKGLIPTPNRNTAGHRIYPQNTVDRIKFFQHASKLGFTLIEAKELLDLSSSCVDVSQRIETKIKDVQTKISALVAMEKALTSLSANCDTTDPLDHCPIIAIIKESK